MSNVHQSQQYFWGKVKNAGKEIVRKVKPKVTAAAKVAGRKAMEGGRWAAIEAYKAYQEDHKTSMRKSKPKKKKKSRRSRVKRRIIEEF